MGKKILIVEDDKFLANAYRVKLEKAGYEVELSYDGAEVFDDLKKFIPDLIITDLIMPKSDGFIIIEKLKKDNRFQAIPIVVASNLGQDEDIEKATSLGAIEYVVKSNLALDELVSKINRIMEVSNG